MNNFFSDLLGISQTDPNSQALLSGEAKKRVFKTNYQSSTPTENFFGDLVGQAKDVGTGLVKGLGELATSPGYAADLITRGAKFKTNITPQQIEQQKAQLAPTNSVQRFGHAIGSLNPGTELGTPLLTKAGINSKLAFGIGLGIDILSPGPGELGKTKKLGKLAQEARSWGELQKTNPELWNTGILRRSKNPMGAKGIIPEDVHSAQAKWQNYGQDSEVSADVLYKRVDSGAFKGSYEDSQGFPVRDTKTGKILEDTYDEATGEYIKPTISNQQLKDNLLEKFSTKDGKDYLNNVIKALPKNADGTITAYRIGAIGEGPQSYTLSEGMAKTFSNQGTDIPLPGTPGLPKGGYKDFGVLPANIVKIDPKGIRAWSPYDAEILVEPKYVKTKSQLTDFYNKVKIGEKSPKLATQKTETLAPQIERSLQGGSKPPPKFPPKSSSYKPSLAQDLKKVNPNVNLSRINISAEGKNVINEVVQDIKPRIEAKVGSRLTNQQAIDFAGKSSKVLKTAIGDDATLQWESAMLRARQKLAQASESGTVDKDYIDTLLAIKTQGTDIARKLQSLSMGADPANITSKEAILESVLKFTQDTDAILKAAEGVDFKNLEQATNFYRKFVKPTSSEWLDLIRYNSMLSSPNTHIINLFSNLVNSSLVAPIEKLVNGGYDFLRASVTKTPRGAFAGEAGAYLKSYFGNIQKATNRFAEVMKGTRAYTNLDIRHLPISTSKTVKALSIPTRLLEASDQFFTALAEGAETGALKFRKAKGVKVGNISSKVSQAAKYRLFRQELKPEGQGTVLNAIDELTGKLQSLRTSKNPIVSNIAKFTVPFIQTPMNIFKQGIEYSPLGVTTAIGAANKQEQIVKAIVGSTIFAGAATMLSSNRLTWAEPTGETDKNAFKAAGMQAYSVKIGNKWYSYQKLPPVLSFPLAMTASLNDLLKNKKVDDDFASLVLGGVAKYGQFLADQSYARNIGDILSSVKGGESSVARLLGNYPQQVIPFRAFSGWLTKLFDDKQRKIDPSGSFVEKQVEQLMQTIPGLSQKTTARVDASGEPIVSKDRFINALSPIKITTENVDKARLFQNSQNLNKAQAEDKARTQDRKSKLKSTYDEVQKLMASGDEAGAQEIVNNLSDEDYSTYKLLKAADKTKASNNMKDQVYPIYLQAQTLLSQDKEDEAQSLIDGLTDEEYKAYASLKRTLSQ